MFACSRWQWNHCMQPERKHTWQQELRYATNYVCTTINSAKKRQLIRALLQFTLLRRCFYPERNVIKWTRRLRGLSCEVHLVQEPLKRLPFGANSTCVELPYTTVWMLKKAIGLNTCRVACHLVSLCIARHLVSMCSTVLDLLWPSRLWGKVISLGCWNVSKFLAT
jgi:hypothetical protein